MVSGRGKRVVLTVLCSTSLAATPVAAADTVAIPLPTPIPLASANDINARGQIIGTSVLSHVVIWDGRRIRDLGVEGTPSRINAHGDVAGETGGGPHIPTSGFYWHGGALDLLPGLVGGEDATALDLNDEGLVVGVSIPADGPSAGIHPVAWRDGALIDLSSCCQGLAVAVDDEGVIVISGGSGVFTWHDGVSQRVAGLDAAAAINAGGAIAGTRGRHAVLWRHGRVLDLGVLPGATSSTASDIDVFGDVVGRSPGQSAESFFWNRHTGMLPLPNLTGMSCLASAINSRRQIVGTCTSAGGPPSAVVWDAHDVVP